MDPVSFFSLPMFPGMFQPARRSPTFRKTLWLMPLYPHSEYSLNLGFWPKVGGNPTPYGAFWCHSDGGRGHDTAFTIYWPKVSCSEVAVCLHAWFWHKALTSWTWYYLCSSSTCSTGDGWMNEKIKERGKTRSVCVEPQTVLDGTNVFLQIYSVNCKIEGQSWIEDVEESQTWVRNHFFP